MSQNFNSNETKKAIIFARVSTESQDYSEQVNRMTAVAMADGYKRENLIEIAVKESAISKSEEQREGLQELKSAVAKDANINAVYVFEISRLGRRMDVICSVLQWLTDCHIQLVCDTPNVRLFDRSGNIDFAGQLLIYICGVMAAQEMKIKKERFANGKERAKKEGRWTGGSVMFGFTINKDKREEVDEAAAEVIRKAYTMYAADENRTAQTNEDIAAYLRKNNVCKRSGKFFSASRVAKFIGQKKYRVTIVAAETWDAANAVRENNYRGSKERKQAFGERLIKCSDCGRNYRRVGEQYVCAAHKPEYKESEMYCENNATLNRKFVECSLVETVAVWWLDEQTKDNKKRMEDIKKQIEILNIRLPETEKKLEKVKGKAKRLGIAYTNGLLDFSDAEFEKKTAEIKKEEKALISERDNILNRIKELRDSLISTQTKPQTWGEQWQRGFNTLSHSEMYDVIHKLVSHVEVKVEGDKKYWTIYRKDSEDKQTYCTFGKGAGVKLFGYLSGAEIDLTHREEFRRDYDKESAQATEEIKDAA